MKNYYYVCPFCGMSMKGMHAKRNIEVRSSKPVVVSLTFKCPACEKETTQKIQ